MTEQEIEDALDALHDKLEALDEREKAAKKKYALQCERLQKLQDAALAALHAEQNEITDANRPLFDELRRIERIKGEQPTPLDNLSENFDSSGFEEAPFPHSLKHELPDE